MCRAHDFSLALIFTILLLIGGISVQAAAPVRQTIYIESDTLLIDEKKGLSHYQGNVKFKQDTLVINANSIKVLAKNGAVEKVLIVGKPTHLTQQPKGQQQPITATATRIEYLASTGIFHMYGNALVTQGSQRFSGEHIQYNSQTAQVTAQGEKSATDNQQSGPDESTTNDGQGRVKAVIMPKRESTSP